VLECIFLTIHPDKFLTIDSKIKERLHFIHNFCVTYQRLKWSFLNLWSYNNDTNLTNILNNYLICKTITDALDDLDKHIFPKFKPINRHPAKHGRIRQRRLLNI